MEFLSKIKYCLKDEKINNILNEAKEITFKFINYSEEKFTEGYEVSSEYLNKQIDDYKKSKEPINENNWYSRAALVCEELNDSILRETNGTSTKITKALVGKIGVAGTSASIFSIASLVGTASTGTAIGSLSGAAFTSASLAWLGGSVLMGSIIVGAASIAGGIGAVLGSKWAYEKYINGKKREKSKLEQEEQNIVEVCLSLATAFRQKEEDSKPIEPMVAKAMYEDVFKPMEEMLLYYEMKDEEGWTKLSRSKFKESLNSLETLNRFTKEFIESKTSISIGIVSAVMMQLLSDNLEFNENEELVLDALRRSNNDLHDATTEELSEYIQSKGSSSLEGLENNIKGIYHELMFVKEENLDNDEYIAKVFTSTNHPGADVVITNTLTNEVKEFQLKATNSTSYIKDHLERYDYEVISTNEVAEQMDNVTSSGFTNEEITEDVRKVFKDLNDDLSDDITSSMSVSALVCLAKNSRVLLEGDKLTEVQKKEMVKSATIAAGTSALVSLLIA